MFEISTGLGLVILGLLYMVNGAFGATVAYAMQSRRLASEERQANIAAKLTGDMKVEMTPPPAKAVPFPKRGK